MIEIFIGDSTLISIPLGISNWIGWVYPTLTIRWFLSSWNLYPNDTVPIDENTII